jgi:hypothetical protein
MARSLMSKGQGAGRTIGEGSSNGAQGWLEFHSMTTWTREVSTTLSSLPVSTKYYHVPLCRDKNKARCLCGVGNEKKTTAPRIPAWSPTVVLTRRHSG